MQNDLISRSALMRRIAHHTVHDSLKRITFEAANTYEQVKGDMFSLVQKAPVVDAAPVVRCKDCVKFWEYTEEHKATVEKADGDCVVRCMAAPDDLQFCAVQKDDYCSMGKRKEE